MSDRQWRAAIKQQARQVTQDSRASYWHHGVIGDCACIAVRGTRSGVLRVHKGHLMPGLGKSECTTKPDNACADHCDLDPFNHLMALRWSYFPDLIISRSRVNHFIRR